MNKTFCVFPFVQTVLRTDGSLGPCCHIQTQQNIKTVDIGQFWKSVQLESMRESMQLGNDIVECNICYKEEHTTGQSMRTKSLKDYKFYGEKYYNQLLDHYNLKKTAFPQRLELHLGNLCNLKCLTCSPKDSSAFLAENQILKISNSNQKDYQLNEQTIDQILDLACNNNIDILDLRGGESMLMPIIKKKLLEFPQDKAKQINLRIQTNCTIMNNDWKKIFKKFKTIEIMMSIDAWGADNEYIRFPASWKEIEKNVEIIIDLKNAKTYINCTVSNLNFLLLPKLIAWAQGKNIHIHWAQLTFPKHFHLTNLPEDLFLKGLAQLDNIVDLQWVKNLKADDRLWSVFCNTINLRDNYRKTSIFNTLPEFKPYWIMS
jgi:sulfatase maturation enzyme AslB (radical SAM superfamily)